MPSLSIRTVALVVVVLLATVALSGCSVDTRTHDANAFPVTTPTPSGTGGPDTSFVNTEYLDVPYSNESTAQRLDIYLPNGGGGHFPVVVAIHGGGFRTGDKADNQLAPMLTSLDRGYAVVSINYRLSGEAKWPAQIYDGKAAIRFLRANAATYSLDPTRIAVWGDSAGGDLAALLGTTGGVTALSDLSQGNPQESDRVEAVVDWFGPIDYTTLDSQFRADKLGRPNRNLPSSPQSQLFGAALPTIPDKVKAANPETYITSDDPPFLIEHGTKDSTIPAQQSVDFAAQLTKTLGADKVTLNLIQGAGHMDAAFTTPEHLATVLDWLDARLK